MTTDRISEQIAKHVVALIVAGDYTIGDRLPSERGLADEKGVSRSAVREGYRMLEGLKLVEIRHGAGVFVAAQPTQGSSFMTVLEAPGIAIDDLLAINDVMSARCGELAAVGITDQEVERLEAMLAAQVSAAAVADLKMLGDLDLEFHVAVAEASRNPIFVEFESYFGAMLEQHRRLLLGADPTDSLYEHRQIVASLKARDPQWAGTASRQHCLRTTAIIRQVIQRQQAAERASVAGNAMGDEPRDHPR